ncbi:MAG TPA: STAS/SEC14 domain-containing protein [Polyangiales bacterium]|nr:STAS/SEC14 domain-containing protein [Polyangiales bacterium]
MAWRFEGRLRVAVHHHAPPSRDEWVDYVREIDDYAGPDQRVLVRSHGGSPNGPQRKLLTDVEKRRVSRSAVLTDNAIVRVVGETIGAVISSVQTFAFDDVDAACKYLGLESAECVRVGELLKELEQELGLRSDDQASA